MDDKRQSPDKLCERCGHPMNRDTDAGHRWCRGCRERAWRELAKEAQE